MVHFPDCGKIGVESLILLLLDSRFYHFDEHLEEMEDKTIEGKSQGLLRDRAGEGKSDA